MADSYPSFTTRPFTRANSIHRRENDSNTYTRFVGKLLFFTFFLLTIPLFPSQAPDFINQTILNKFWELLHLMFIGIAVSYGLFGRRNVDNVVANLDDSQSFVSSMFHVSSVFEDGFDHSMYCSGGRGKAGFSNVKNGSFFENPYEENVVQAWSSKYFQGEPMVVLAQPNCDLENYGDSNSGSFIGYKPLGLPVRSLKSSPDDEFGNESSDSSGPIVKDSSDSSNKSGNGRLSDLGSENLEAVKSNEGDVLGSRIAWRSRSGRMIGERVHGGASHPSTFRPLSVDETQLESLKSRSLRSTFSFSSQASSQSHSPSSNSLSPTSHSNSSESPKSNMSELVMESSPMSSKAPVDASHSRQYSDCSLLGSRGKRCFEDESLNEFCESKIKYDSLSGTGSSKEWISGSLRFDAKPLPTMPTSKASSRGKSVRIRTFRSFRASVCLNTKGARVAAGEKLRNHKKGKLRLGSDEIEPKTEGDDNLSIGFNSQNFGGESYMPKPTSPENQNTRKQECSDISAEEINEDFDQVTSSDEETISGTSSVAAGSEVDRKASEFIAKFREQIRLQRTTSIDTPSPRGLELDITGNFFR